MVTSLKTIVLGGIVVACSGRPTARLPETPSAPLRSVDPAAGATPATPVISREPEPTPSDCTGDLPSSAAAELSLRASYGRICYQRLLRSSPAVEGRMVVAVRVGPGGRLVSAGIVEDGLQSEELTTCLLSRFRGAVSAGPERGCVDVHVPIRLSVQQQLAADWRFDGDRFQ